MATETELKLSIDPGLVETLLHHPLLQSAPKQQHLYNTYFDTDDLALTRQKVAVRERRIGEQTLLTIKTAGRSQNGFSQRLEWEGPTEPGAFNFCTLVDDAALASALAALAPKLLATLSARGNARWRRCIAPRGWWNRQSFNRTVGEFVIFFNEKTPKI
ncbi:MAG: inorganic triphosphatase [Fluviibacter sp.]